MCMTKKEGLHPAGLLPAGALPLQPNASRSGWQYPRRILMEPELTNERAMREWQWLCSEVGETVARATISTLPGNRRPYPLNIARALDVKLPAEEKLPPLLVPADGAVMDAALAQARQALRGR